MDKETAIALLMFNVIGLVVGFMGLLYTINGRIGWGFFFIGLGLVLNLFTVKVYIEEKTK